MDEKVSQHIEEVIAQRVDQLTVTMNERDDQHGKALKSILDALRKTRAVTQHRGLGWRRKFRVGAPQVTSVQDSGMSQDIRPLQRWDSVQVEHSSVDWLVTDRVVQERGRKLRAKALQVCTPLVYRVQGLVTLERVCTVIVFWNNLVEWAWVWTC